MKKLFIFCLLMTSFIQPAASKERSQAAKEYLEKRKKKKKNPFLKMGVSQKKQKISENAPLVLLDEVQAVVTTILPEKAQITTSIVTMQDVTRQCFDGGQYKTDDLIDMALMDHLSQAFKVDVTTDDINRYCQKMNLSTEQLMAIAKNWWFPSLDAFYDLFKRNYRGRMALNILVESQVVVSEEEIKKYWEDNPIWLEPVYFVETVFIPFNGKNLETLQKEIADKEARNKLSDLDWDPVAKVLESEVGTSNNFIFNLAVGDSYLKPHEEGVIIYRLQNKLPRRAKPLEERKAEISMRLKMEKSFIVEEEERKKLRNDALIYQPKFESPLSTKEL